jgi:hypothetical protein
MKWLAALAAACALTCGVALGQTEQKAPPPVRVEGPWGKLDASGFESRPVGRDYADNYPAKALNRSMGATVLLCCKPKPDRTLDCRVGAEWPGAEWKFGEASLKIAQKFRMSPAAHATIMAHPDAELRLPIRWKIEPSDERYNAALERAHTVISAAPLCRGDRRLTPVS